MDTCLEIHKIINSLPLYHWNEIDNISFNNGIYFVFEHEEYYKGYCRIVRIGTHRRKNRLKIRLKNHFIQTRHNSSIFIKNIGRVYINQEEPEYLDIWNAKPSKLNESEKALYLKKHDSEKDKFYEHRASEYLRNNMTFTVINVDDDDERLRFEEAFIATLAKTEDFVSSDNWLGKNSPVEAVRTSGMWLEQGLKGEPFTLKEYQDFTISVKGIESL